MSSDDYKKKMTTLPPVPEGMSKSQWKKVWKKQRYTIMKEEYANIRKEKRKRARENRRAKIQEFIDRGEDIPQEFKRRPRENPNQKDSKVNIVLDCGFDELMNDREIVSMSNQITRVYSSNRRENHFTHIDVTSFNKRLKTRFDEEMKGCHYEHWKNFEFHQDDELIMGPNVDKTKLVYLTADTDDKLEALEPGMTYIVGGIVDKNRHKLLCYNKAKEMGIPAKRLPIDEFINISGRKVLTTTHVVQLMLKYFDNHDWKEAFEYVLPPRKLDQENSQDDEDEDEDEEDNGDSEGGDVS